MSRIRTQDPLQHRDRHFVHSVAQEDVGLDQELDRLCARFGRGADLCLRPTGDGLRPLVEVELEPQAGLRISRLFRREGAFRRLRGRNHRIEAGGRRQLVEIDELDLAQVELDGALEGRRVALGGGRRRCNRALLRGGDCFGTFLGTLVDDRHLFVDLRLDGLRGRLRPRGRDGLSIRLGQGGGLGLLRHSGCLVRRKSRPRLRAQSARLWIRLDGDVQQVLRQPIEAATLERLHRLADEVEIVRIDRQTLGEDAQGVVTARVLEHQPGDLVVLIQRLAGPSLPLKKPCELQPPRRVVRLDLHHLAVDADRRLGVAVPLVVLGHHLVLGQRVAGEALPVVEVGQGLVGRDLGRIEPDDLLVDGDRLDEKTLPAKALRGLREELDRLGHPIEADVKVADAVESARVARVPIQDLAVLVDSSLYPSLGDELLGCLNGLLAVRGHQCTASPSRGRTLRNVSRWQGDGPNSRSASRCSGAA